MIKVCHIFEEIMHPDQGDIASVGCEHRLIEAIVDGHQKTEVSQKPRRIKRLVLLQSSVLEPHLESGKAA